MQRVIDKTGRFLDPHDHFRDSTAFVADPGQGGFVRLRNLCRDDDGRSFPVDLVEKVQRCPAGSSPSNQNTQRRILTRAISFLWTPTRTVFRSPSASDVD